MNNVQHVHHLCRTVNVALRRFAIAGGSGRAHDCLSDSYLTNFHKLRYWGLIEKRGRGWDWHITARGYQYLDREITLPKTAITYNGRLMRYDGPQVSFNLDPDALVWTRNDYARAAIKIQGEQALLF